MVNTKKIFQFSTTWIGLVSLLGEHRRQFFSLLKHIFTDYLFNQYGRKPAISIDTILDKDIASYPKAIGTYFGFVPLLLDNFGYLKQEFGEKIRDDIDKFLGDLVDLYKNAGFVFKNAPTTLKSRDSRGFGLRALHFLDRPRNYFPSLHVILVSYTYFQTCRIIEKYSNGQDYIDIRNALFNRTVGVIESCLLTKQHGIRDIAGGLSIISLKDGSFNIKIAEEIIAALFKENTFGMRDEFISDLRGSVLGTYQDIVGAVVGREIDGFYSHPLVSYVRSI